MSNETVTLGDALPREMARVMDELMPIYQQIPTGVLALTMMRHSLDAAAKAMAEGDTLAMLLAYEDLKGYEV